MRELLYVSTRKLDNFDVGRRWFRATSVDTELRIPLLNIRLGADRAPPSHGMDMAKLTAVSRKLNKDATAWSDSGLSGGRWVRFSMRLGFEIFSVTGRDGERFDIALFGGQAAHSDGRRLLLCGSATHVLGSGVMAYGFEPSQSDPPPTLDGVRDLASEGLASQFAPRHAALAYDALLECRPVSTHEMLSGHARVIFAATEPEDIVLATPLYVQYGEMLSVAVTRHSALNATDVAEYATPVEMSEIRKGACNLCEAMCALRIEVSAGRVTDIRGDPEDPLSRGHICPKAVTLADIRDDPDRLRHPVRKVDGQWREISWKEAIDTVAAGLARARTEHGADAAAVYLGNPVVHSLGAMTHGPAFINLLQTRNRYSAGSLDTLPHMIVSRQMYGHQWLSPVPDIDRTQQLLVLGANPMVSNGSMMTAPGFARRVKALRARKGRLIVIDPRRTDTARAADAHHFIRPGTDVALLLSMVRTIFDENLARPASYVTGIAEVRQAVEPFTVELAHHVTGLPPETIQQLATDFATAPSAACYGRMGVSTQPYGVLCHWAIQLLNVLTGNLDAPGGTMLPAPAVDGIASGVLPRGDFGAGSRVRGLTEFGGERPAVTLADEIATSGPGQVRALLTVAGNPVLSVPGGHRLNAELSNLDFMASIDFYINETTRHADVILPATEALERDHYDVVMHMLAVRNTARYTPAVFPKPSHARHEWQIFAALARAYRRHIRTGKLRDRLTLRLSPARLIDLALRTGGYHLSLRRLIRAPHGVDLGPLRPSLPKRLRTKDQRVHAAPRRFVDMAADAAARLRDTSTGELMLIGRRHTRSNNSWMHNLPRLVKGRRRHQLWMHPDDLDARGIASGQTVRLSSRAGAVEVEVEACTDLMPGVVSLPHGFGHDRHGVRLGTARGVGGVSANDVVDPGEVDPTGVAVLNAVAVTVEASRGTYPR